MNPKRKQCLLIVLKLVSGLGIAVGLVMFALSQNINLFFTPTQIAAASSSAQMIRVGGMVADGTVDRDPQSLKVVFDVTDFDHNVRVTYEGILPDLFRGLGVVVQGRIRSGQFVASEALAKHDENWYATRGHRLVQAIRKT